MKARHSCHPAVYLLLLCTATRRKEDDIWIPEPKFHRDNGERDWLWEKPIAPFIYLCCPLLPESNLSVHLSAAYSLATQDISYISGVADNPIRVLENYYNILESSSSRTLVFYLKKAT